MKIEVKTIVHKTGKDSAYTDDGEAKIEVYKNKEGDIVIRVDDVEYIIPVWIFTGVI